MKICEDDVEWHTGDCDDELDESAYAVGPPTDDPELLEQFDGNLEDADASASLVCASASRSFQDARDLLSRAKSARGDVLVGTGALEGLAQPSADRKPAKSRGKGKKGKRKGKLLRTKSGKFPNLGALGVLPKPPTSRRPMSMKRPTETGTNRGGLHHTLRLRLNVHVVSPSWASCIRMFRQRENDFNFTRQACVWNIGSGQCCVRCHV